ncbi:murein biosynthesis integral membrane protein MurJ [Granulicella arctica]|uniref:Putative peptidoglycan lipid II flippase n=1 Tax=Granulicella arctica TaxID=940613 RepID=A0A7Y9PFV5_9BACT|nr:lipid II flippase MurJ [Granulicella arctica]NYF78929.1 putative peptidoglycan lipid II flippase [Granulicella arctica]
MIDHVSSNSIPAVRRGLASRLLGMLRPSATHTAFSATLLLMASTVLSGMLGLVRTKYIAYLFGAGAVTDAYYAAFQLPDMINYFLIGGVVSTSLLTMLNRYQKSGDVAGGDRALSAVLNAMLVVLMVGVLLGEIFAPLYTHVAFPAFQGQKADLCIALTRLLLPAQLFFFAGGVLGSRLLVRKIFLYQAVTPMLYNVGIILGAVFLHRRYGAYSLAIGVLAGAFVGSLVMNAVGAFRNGMQYRLIFNLRDAAFLEWLRLSLPLMIGVSLTMADKWILSYFASDDTGGISRMNVAKTLFNAPLGILGAAAGAASLPFFAALFSQGKMVEFAAAVNRSASRVIAVSVMAAGWMIALSGPIVDLYRGGSFSRNDATETAAYFGVFSLSIALWSAQGFYARAFYAVGNTRVPAIVGWIVTLVSLPIYSTLFHRMGMLGLAIASDLGILILTVTLAVLLDRRGMVPLSGLEAGEMVMALTAGSVGFAGAAACVGYLPVAHGHRGDLLLIGVGTVVWGGLCFGVLTVMGSRLPGQILRRRT